jgi:hypothetical protein
VFLFLDRKTKEPVGNATITYQAAEFAKKAIEIFHNKAFGLEGPVIKVQVATPEQKNPFAEMLVSLMVKVYLSHQIFYLVLKFHLIRKKASW